MSTNLDAETLKSVWNSVGKGTSRAEAVRQLVRQDPTAWRSSFLGLIPPFTTSSDMACFETSLAELLILAEDRPDFEAQLAEAAHADRSVAYVVVSALLEPASDGGARHALEVLGEHFIFDTWRRYKSTFRIEDRQEQKPDVVVDRWAWDVMEKLLDEAPDELWLVFLRYLEYESESLFRGWAGIDWLEGLMIMDAPSFIDRVVDEAKTNARLRAVIRGTYRPNGTHELQQRYKEAGQEPAK